MDKNIQKMTKKIAKMALFIYSKVFGDVRKSSPNIKAEPRTSRTCVRPTKAERRTCRTPPKNPNVERRTLFVPTLVRWLMLTYYPSIRVPFGFPYQSREKYQISLSGNIFPTRKMGNNWDFILLNSIYLK